MADFGASEILPLLLESGAAAAPAAAGVAGTAGAAAEAAPLFLGATEAVPAAAADVGAAGAGAGTAAAPLTYNQAMDAAYSELPNASPLPSGGGAAATDPWGGWGGGAGQDIGGGWKAAPDMQAAGYGLPDASQGLDDWWTRNFGHFDKDKVTKALGSLGAAKNAMQKQTPLAPSMPGNLAAAQLGKGGGGSGLSTVLQLLQQRRQALLSSATAGPGGQARPSGLLGM